MARVLSVKIASTLLDERSAELESLGRDLEVIAEIC